jgi:hypothetical protein
VSVTTAARVAPPLSPPRRNRPRTARSTPRRPVFKPSTSGLRAPIVRCWHQKTAASRRLPQPPSRASSQAAESSPHTVQACMQMPIVRRPAQRGPVKQPTAIGRPTQTRLEPTRHRPLRKLPILSRTNHNTGRTICRPIRRIQTRHIRIVRARTTITPRLTRTRAIRANPGVNPPPFSPSSEGQGSPPGLIHFAGVCAFLDSVGNSACSTTGERGMLAWFGEFVGTGRLAGLLVGSLGSWQLPLRLTRKLQNGFMVYALQTTCGTLWRGQSIPDLAALAGRVRFSFF